MKPFVIAITLFMACWSMENAYALKTLIINNNNSDASSGPFRLLSSIPGDRQTLDNPPTRISFTFSGPIKPDKSTIRLYNLNGDQIDSGGLDVQGANMSVTVSDLTAGKYIIKWRVRCQCDDNSELSDSFHFTVQ